MPAEASVLIGAGRDGVHPDVLRARDRSPVADRRLERRLRDAHHVVVREDAVAADEGERQTLPPPLLHQRRHGARQADQRDSALHAERAMRKPLARRLGRRDSSNASAFGANAARSVKQSRGRRTPRSSAACRDRDLLISRRRRSGRTSGRSSVAASFCGRSPRSRSLGICQRQPRARGFAAALLRNGPRDRPLVGDADDGGRVSPREIGHGAMLLRTLPALTVLVHLRASRSRRLAAPLSRVRRRCACTPRLRRRRRSGCPVTDAAGDLHCPDAAA